MAGDWLKIEYATIDKPEIIAMADLMEKSPDEVFGMCFRVWCWFDANSTDGNAGSNAGSVTGASLLALVNRLAGDVRFAASMKKVGWLTDAGVTNFAYHMGESAKKRALTARRQKTHREKSNAKSNAEVTLSALPEKRREEVKEGAKKPRPDLEFIFTDGLAAFIEQGHSEPSARAVLGKMTRDFGEGAVARALVTAMGKADVKTYAMKILSSDKKAADDSKVRRLAL